MSPLVRPLPFYCCETFYVSTGIVHFSSLLTFVPLLVDPAGETALPLPSLYTLLLLVPLVAAVATAAAAAWVLLWRQKHSSDGGESSSVSRLDSFSCSVHLGAQLSDAGRDNLWGCCNEPAPIVWQCWGHTYSTPLCPFALRNRAVSLHAHRREHLRESRQRPAGDESRRTQVASDEFLNTFLFLSPLCLHRFSPTLVVCVPLCFSPPPCHCLTLCAISLSQYCSSISLPVPFVVH